MQQNMRAPLFEAGNYVRAWRSESKSHLHCNVEELNPLLYSPMGLVLELAKRARKTP